MTRRAGEHLEQVAIADLDALRRWLAANHGRRESVWLVLPRKGGGRDGLPWSDLVDEALCWGWIDSLPRKLDETRTMLLLSPRKPGSGWSRVNRNKVVRLIADGRMQPPGLVVVDAAKADGSFDRLAEIDDLAPPPDLAAALAAEPVAQAAFERFPPASRRAILEWIVTARKAETRAARIVRTVALAARGMRVNHAEARGLA